MNFRDLSPTLSDFENCDWEEAIEAAETRDCRAYRHLFPAKTKESHEAGDEQAQVVFMLLNGATSLYLNDPTNSMCPFGPMHITAEGRTADVGDFTDEHLAVFGQLVPKIKDPELRARIADIVWVRKREHKVADQAIRAYLASARRLEGAAMTQKSCVDRIKRAVTLAALHGRNRQTFKQTIAHIEDTLDRHEDNDPSYLSADLMEILLDQKEGDCTKYAQISEEHALSAAEDEDWERPRRCWDLCARWRERAGDESGSRAARIKAAEVYVNVAESRLKQGQPDYLAAAELTQSAIEALRRIGGEKERVKKLHLDLLEYQRESLSQFGRFSAETSITDHYANAVKTVRGKPLREAIRALALIGSPPELESLRQQLKKDMQGNLFYYAMPSVPTDASGRTTGFVPSILSGSEEDREAATHSHLLREASYMRSWMVQARIEPAWRQILQEHYVRAQDFAPLVANNPFVPEGRESLYARGLHAGLEGDLVVAVHLLTPQLENSIRHVLTQHGVITSSLDKGIQKEHLLGSMLCRCEMEKIFGEDITFDLQGLLVKSETGVGDNLRNEVAHGLMDGSDFYRTHAIYLWWLTLHLLFRILLARESQTEPS